MSWLPASPVFPAPHAGEKRKYTAGGRVSYVRTLTMVQLATWRIAFKCSFILEKFHESLEPVAWDKLVMPAN